MVRISLCVGLPAENGMLRHEVQSSEFRSVGYDISASVLCWSYWRRSLLEDISTPGSAPRSGSRKCDNIIPRIFDLEIYR
jgi:hypothetical protein